MKKLIAFTFLLFGMLSGANTALAQVNSDIVLEGPWVLYEEQHFVKDPNTNPATTVSVLIAMAPAGDNTPNSKKFHLPRLNNGDGYYILSGGIYCLTFDTECAPKQPKGKTKLDTDSYPNPSPGGLLGVAVTAPSAGASWDWASRYTSGTYGQPTVLILPMPDSYNDDARWPMRFGPTYSSTGSNYANQAPYSIGVHLHYSNAPKNSFDLLQCPKPPFTAKSCNVVFAGDNGHVTTLQNFGVLRIEMKAPESADACDYHVRAAYPLALNIAGDPDKHKNLAVIDTAYNTNPDGSAVFDDGSGTKVTCLKDDPQGGSGHLMMAADLTPFVFSFDLLNTLKANLNLLTADDRKILLSDQIADVIDHLDHRFPKISQLLYLQTLLLESSHRAQSLLDKYQLRIELSRLDSRISRFDSSRPSRNTNGVNDDQELEAIRNAQTTTNVTIAVNPAKDAKDCRAPMILVSPQ